MTAGLRPYPDHEDHRTTMSDTEAPTLWLRGTKAGIGPLRADRPEEFEGPSLVKRQFES